MIKEIVKNILFRLKKNNSTFTPVFIIGCGRSGTTILGETLSLHPKIKYLNERRDLWHQSYPEFNIWDENILNPTLYANEKDYSEEKTSKLRNLFFREQVLENASILLEKLPINNFRLEFLKKSFPEAKYIYLSRNGLEVSKSIEKRIQKKNWFTGSKFKLLQQFSGLYEYCAECGGAGGFLGLGNHKIECEECEGTGSVDAGDDNTLESDEQKGMWEWKLSINESDLFFKNLSKDKYYHLSYQDFIEDTEDSLKQIYNFLNLNTTEEFLSILSKNISRKNKTITKTDDKLLLEMGGEILTQTINNNYSPF